MKKYVKPRNIKRADWFLPYKNSLYDQHQNEIDQVIDFIVDSNLALPFVSVSPNEIDFLWDWTAKENGEVIGDIIVDYGITTGGIWSYYARIIDQEYAGESEKNSSNPMILDPDVIKILKQ